MADSCQNEQQPVCQNNSKDMMQVIEVIGAGEGNRTLVISLEGCCSTIELHPRNSTAHFFGMARLHRSFGGQSSRPRVIWASQPKRRQPRRLVGEVGLEPTK